MGSFRSMQQYFECPLSTTVLRDVAEEFADGDCGIVLKLKRANMKTKYLNVTSYSAFADEESVCS